MPFIKKFNEDFYIKDQKIYLNDQYLLKNKNKFKKITGTRLSAVLGLNKYNTPLMSWLVMTGLFRDEMDETLAKAGQVIEPKVRSYVEEKLKIKYKVYNPFGVNWDVFPDNEVFGGIPDGEPLNEQNKIDLYKPMLEIKTTSYDSFVYKKENGSLKMQKDHNNIPLIKIKNGKYQEWFKNKYEVIIPVDYQYQLGLYMYLRKMQEGLFAIAFLKPEHYANPYDYDIKSAEILLVGFSINHDHFEKEMTQAKTWYEKHIKTGISPELTDKDIEFLKEHNIKYE